MNKTERRSLAVSRRAFLGRAAGAGTILGADFLRPDMLVARDHHDHGDHAERGGRPNAIPLGITPFAPFAIFIHRLPPTPPLTDINDVSTITDFDGFVGFTRIRGGGIGTDTDTGETRELAFQVDQGFNQGTFIGTDGRRHEGTLAFV